MKIEKLTRDNIEEFMRDLGVSDSKLEKEINKLEYYGVKEEDKFYMAFIVLSEDDRIAIQFVSDKLSDSEFLEFINYLNNSLVVNNHLIVQVYDEKYMNILSDNYRCKDVCVTLIKKNSSDDISVPLKEQYAEIDMLNIRYLGSNDKIICNLLRQNIQDENIITMLHNYFKTIDVNSISFIIPLTLLEFMEKLGYSCFYESYVIENI